MTRYGVDDAPYSRAPSIHQNTRFAPPVCPLLRIIISESIISLHGDGAPVRHDLESLNAPPGLLLNHVPNHGRESHLPRIYRQDSPASV